MLVVVMFSTGCMGMRKAKETEVLYKPGDRTMDCTEITTELNELVVKRDKMKKEISGKKTGNVVSVVLGVVFLLPFLAMDLSSDENKALESMEARYGYLYAEGVRQDCDMKPYDQTNASSSGCDGGFPPCPYGKGTTQYNVSCGENAVDQQFCP